jgi:hypothetical protein
MHWCPVKSENLIGLRGTLLSGLSKANNEDDFEPLDCASEVQLDQIHFSLTHFKFRPSVFILVGISGFLLQKKLKR